VIKSYVLLHHSKAKCEEMITGFQHFGDYL
jgi:hypothetical protein